MDQQASDPVIDEIREIRHGISAGVGHDPGRLVAHYVELQKQYQDRLVGIRPGEGEERPEGGSSPAVNRGGSPPAAAESSR